MPPIVSHIEIARPPEEVFAYITDPSRFHEWQHDVVRVDLQGDGLAGVGASSPPPAGSVVPSGR
jgi:uncharacterized protein YndB with AHSA1/START domain